MDKLSNWFWNDKFWLPPGVSFLDIKSNQNVSYPRPRDLFALPLYGFTAYIIRILYEKYVTNPIVAKLWKVDLKALEKANEIHDQRRRRKLQKISCKMAKIAEASWKSIFNVVSFTYGFCVLLRAPWFWDTHHCWIGYPRHPLWPSVYWYYMIEGAYFSSLLFHNAHDLQRKDGVAMLLHHLVALILIVFSYATNEIRLGSLWLLLHSAATIFLHLTKILLYCTCNAAAYYSFNVFAFTFVFTRLFIYPLYLLHTLFVKFYWHFQPYPWHYIAQSLAIVLQSMHILWSYMIVKTAIRNFRSSALDRDDRSDSEKEEEEEVNGREETEKKQN